MAQKREQDTIINKPKQQIKMERAAMEAQMQMTLQMITLCKQKCLKASHSAASLSDAETMAINNCMKKYLEAPAIVM